LHHLGIADFILYYLSVRSIIFTANVPGISSTVFFTPISLSLLCSGFYWLRCSPYVLVCGWPGNALAGIHHFLTREFSAPNIGWY